MPEREKSNVLYGTLSFWEQEIMFLDMDADHPAPEFSWAASIYGDCLEEAEFDAVFRGLLQSGVWDRNLSRTFGSAYG